MLHFPPGQRFACSGCGRCCRAPWNVVVDGASAGRVRGTALELRVIQERGGAALQADREGRLVTARTRGACVFLDAANRCRIHSDLGAAAKPRTCRQFPFTFRATPGGVFVGVSFFCPAVVGNEGPLLEESEAEIRAMLAEAPLDEGSWSPEAWVSYRALEAELRDAVAARPVSEALRDALSRRLGGPPPPGLEAFVAARFVGWLEYPGDVAAGEALASALRARRGRIRLPRFGWEGDVADLEAQVARVPPAPDLESAIRRYVDALLFRKALLERPLAEGLALLHVAAPLIRWYAGVSAGLRGSADPSDLALALEICELELVTHARGQDPLLRDFVRLWSQAGGR